MKKIIFIITSLVIILSFVGCSSERDFNSDTDNTSESETQAITDIETYSEGEYISGEEIEGSIPDIQTDNIVEKLCSFGFTMSEAENIREIFLKCGLDNIDNAKPTDPNATIDGLISYRVVMDKERTAWFTVDNREVFYIGMNGEDVYDTDKGGYLINIDDIHVPESKVSESAFDKLKSITETTLDSYFVNALYYDAWGVSRSDNSYMIRCEVYANNKLGIKDWIKAKVWFEYDGDNYNVTGVVIDGVRYK